MMGHPRTCGGRWARRGSRVKYLYRKKLSRRKMISSAIPIDLSISCGRCSKEGGQIFDVVFVWQWRWLNAVGDLWGRGVRVWGFDADPPVAHIT